LGKELKLFLDWKIVLVHNLSFPAFFLLLQLQNSSVVSHLEYMSTITGASHSTQCPFLKAPFLSDLQGKNK